VTEIKQKIAAFAAASNLLETLDGDLIRSSASGELPPTA
jgi:hypothetical protein